MGQDQFSSFISFADHVSEEIARGQRSAQKFKFLIGTISRTLVQTHTIVLQRLEAIEEASSPEEAQELLDAIRSEQLMEAFRVEGLCDALGGLGSGLINRSYAAREEGVFSDAELEDLERFAAMLFDREMEVAIAYVEALSDLTVLDASDDGFLPDLKDRVRDLKQTMTSQVADFKAKADRFMKLSA